MEAVTTIAELRQVLDGRRSAFETIGFVPTMGFLHAGHLSLVEQARRDCDHVVVSIFVNPLQFGPAEDFSTYPRDLDRDLDLLRQAGAHSVFVPEVKEMYPDSQVLTSVSVGLISEQWEGAFRPTHFSGIATVVSKLFAIVGRSKAYFGEKDFQQLAIVKRLASDLSFPVDVIGCPIVREPDGLAMSSRNVYLSPEERTAATVLYRALTTAQEAIANGERSSEKVARLMSDIVDDEPLAKLDYAAAVSPETMTEPESVTDGDRLIIAAKVGARTRLIDNMPAFPRLLQQNL